MTQLIRKYYLETSLGYLIFHPIFLLYELYQRQISDEIYIRNKFQKKLGYPLKLDNPKTFNEKINFLKLYYKPEILTLAADKYRVREYIANKIGKQYLIPLIFETKSPKDIKPENLPDFPFIIKTNHNSSGGLIVRDKNTINWSKQRKKFARLLRENHFYSTREWQYKNIEPRLVVEKLLLEKNDQIPYDYKLHFFNQKIIFTQVDIDRSTNHTRNLYDKNWNLIPCEWEYPNGKHIEKPRVYDKMIELGEKLSQDFDYVRVDFYILGSTIYFGELTFHSESGLGKFDPEYFDFEFGSLLDISNQLIKTNSVD